MVFSCVRPTTGYTDTPLTRLLRKSDATKKRAARTRDRTSRIARLRLPHWASTSTHKIQSHDCQALQVAAGAPPVAVVEPKKVEVEVEAEPKKVDPLEPLSFRNIFTQATILVRVGPSEEEFYVHKALAMQHPALFCGDPGADKFKESETDVVTLRDTKPCTFTAFLDWLYHSDLSDWDEWSKQYCNGGDNISWQLQVTCLYVFADRFLIPGLKKEVIKHAIRWDFDDKVPEPRAVNYAYDNLPRNSPFLKFLVDCFLSTFEEDSYKEADGSELGVFARFPHEFMHSVILKYATKRNEAHVEMKVSNYIESKQKEDGEDKVDGEGKKDKEDIKVKEYKEDGEPREPKQLPHNIRQTFRRTL